MCDMPVITQIVEPKARPNRRRIYLDGKFAFTVKLNVVAKFRLREGLTLSPDQITAIEQGEIRQECLDHAMKYLTGRPLNICNSSQRSRPISLVTCGSFGLE